MAEHSIEYITLREYFESRLSSIEKSTTLAANAMEKRLEGMNEFRESLKDQASKFITKDEYSVVIGRINDDIRELREARAKQEGKASVAAVVVAYIISVASLVAAIISLTK